MATLDILFDEYKHLWNKRVIDSTGHFWGTFLGVAGDDEDYYYILQAENKSVTYLTAVTGLEPYDIP